MAKHGENIRKRKDGRWEGRYIKGRKPDKTAVWGYIYGHSYTEVKEKLIRKKNEVRQFALETYNPTFSELSLSWESSIFLGVKASTATHYHYTLQHYILPVLGDYQIQAIDEGILENSLLEIISPSDENHKPLGCTMSKECVTLVRRICRYASHLHLMRPIEICLKLPTQKSVVPAVLSDQEQKTVCTYVLSDPTPRKIGVLLMMQMGLRIGEVCGLRWGDFDLQNGALAVRRTVKRIYVDDGKTSLVIQSPKTASSERAIPIPLSILNVLKELHPSHGNDTWFLSGMQEKTVEPRCYYKSLQGYLKHAGVPTLRPHTLRHTFATTCLQAGCNVKTLSELMGHASPDVTLKRYAHSCWEWKREEINRIYR